MTLNPALIGNTLSAEPTTISAEAFQAYARACNDDNPRYFDASCAGGVIAPPMFAVVAGWMPLITTLTDPALRADLLRLLHTAQDIRFIEPIRPGDVITASARIAAIETIPAGEAIDLQIEASNQTGAIVSRSTFSAIIRGRRHSARASESSKPDLAKPPNTHPLLTVEQQIDSDQTFRYAEASGDRNPIHTDENVAKMAGLPRIIVHGLCTIAFTSKIMINELCGGDPLGLKRLSVNFSRPVFPGDKITTKVWESATRDGLRTYSYETYNPAGLPVLRDGIAEISQ